MKVNSSLHRHGDGRAAVLTLRIALTHPQSTNTQLTSQQHSATMSTEENKKNIAANRKKVYELENTVHANRAQAYLVRAQVRENLFAVLKNYTAAFNGNRQLANENTADLFRNRTAIVRNVESTTPVLANFKEAKSNQVKLEFLEHRAKLTEKNVAISEKLAAINKQLIEVNHQIMEVNEEVVKYNAAAIATNSSLLSTPASLGAGASPSSNADLIVANARKIEQIAQKAAENKAKISKVLSDADANRVSILDNSSEIHNRRNVIIANHEKIAANQQLVSRFVGKL